MYPRSDCQVRDLPIRNSTTAKLTEQQLSDKDDAMSMSPNNPFEDPQHDQVPPQSPPPTRSGSKGCLIGCGIAGALCLFVCCGGGLVMVQFGVSMLASEYQRQLTGNPVIVEQIGEIESVEPSWSATFREAQKGDQQGDEISFAFEIKGSKGSGTLLAEQEQGGDGTGIASATLVMPDGTRHPIDISAGPAAVEDLDVELDDLFDSGEIDTAEGTTESPPVELEKN